MNGTPVDFGKLTAQHSAPQSLIFLLRCYVIVVANIIIVYSLMIEDKVI